jgi:hypothetical protein
MKLNFVLLSVVFLFVGCSSLSPQRSLSSIEETNILFPSNIHKTKEIFVFGNIATSGVTLELSDIFDKINSKKNEEDKVKLRYFIELPVETSDGVAQIVDPKKQLRDLSLNNTKVTYLARELPGSLKHSIFYMSDLDNYGYKPDLWMQDYGQFYILDGVPHFLDLSYAKLGNTSEIHRYIRSPIGLRGKVDEKFKGRRDSKTINKTLEGGDIEALPNGTVLLGSEIHPDLEKYIKDDLRQKVLKVSAGYVATGHVDEIFSIVPIKKNPNNTCGYALTHIDPMYGLRLALDKKLVPQQLKSRQKFLDALKYFTGVEGVEAISPEMFSKISSKFVNFKDKPLEITEEPWGNDPDLHQWYVYKALEIDLSVKEGVALIKSELSSECPNLQVIGLPVLMTDEAAGESSLFKVDTEGKSIKEMSALYKKASVSFLISPVNQVVVDEHLIIPTIQDMSTGLWFGDFLEKYIEVYKWIVPARLEKFGIDKDNIHFISSVAFVRNGGAIHCGTTSVRSDRRLY